jgi:hypothetical protein
MRLRAEQERPALAWWEHLAVVLVGVLLVVLAHVPVVW